MQNLEQKYLSSREVAEMVEKNHADLLKDIRRYCVFLNEGNFPLVEYFKESTYQDAKGESRGCYLVTKKGCEFIAHKMTGQKGAIFTARYIEKFHEMEDFIQKPKNNAEMLLIFAQQMVEQEQRLSTIENKVEQIEAHSITSTNEFFTIAGFASLRNEKVDISRANILGRKAANLSRKYGYEIGKASDPRFGTVNTYHIDVLNEIFKAVI